MTVAVSITDIHAVLGATDRRTIDRILAAAPTRAELEEAASAEACELSFGEGPNPFTSPRVEQVREILAELADTETEQMALASARRAP